MRLFVFLHFWFKNFSAGHNHFFFVPCFVLSSSGILFCSRLSIKRESSQRTCKRRHIHTARCIASKRHLFMCTNSTAHNAKIGKRACLTNGKIMIYVLQAQSDCCLLFRCYGGRACSVSAISSARTRAGLCVVVMSFLSFNRFGSSFFVSHMHALTITNSNNSPSMLTTTIKYDYLNEQKC